MKNMLGVLPPAKYQLGGHWKKSAMHANLHEAILDLNRHRSPDLTLMDATVGTPEAHLWGRVCVPPVGKLLAGTDPVAIDAHASGLLKRDPSRIGHIAMADGILGSSSGYEIVRG